MNLSELAPLLHALGTSQVARAPSLHAPQLPLGPKVLARLRSELERVEPSTPTTQLLQLLQCVVRTSIPLMLQQLWTGANDAWGGCVTSGMLFLSLPAFSKVASGQDMRELTAALPPRVPRMTLPELAAAAPFLPAESSKDAWARLAELAESIESNESFELVLTAAGIAGLNSPPPGALSELVRLVEQLEPRAASAPPGLQAQFLLLALRAPRLEDPDTESSESSESTEAAREHAVQAVVEHVGGRLAAADLAGLPWVQAESLLRALAGHSHDDESPVQPVQPPPGLVGGLVEVLFAGDRFDRTVAELAEVFFALARLGAQDLESLAVRCDLAAKLAAPEELELAGLIRLFWAMAVGQVQDPVAWQLCTERIQQQQQQPKRPSTQVTPTEVPNALARLRAEAAALINS